MHKVLAVLPFLLATTLAQAEPVEWTFDSSHSRVGFRVPHLMVSNVTGRFKEVERSKIVIDDQNLANSKIEIDIKAASVDTDDAKRDEHLRGPEFLDAGQFPQLKFVSTKVAKAGKGYKVTGKLTIRGVTKEVALTATLSQPVKNPWGKQVRAATLTGTINRGDFGLQWNKTLDAGGVLIGDKVTLEISAEVNR